MTMTGVIFETGTATITLTADEFGVLMRLQPYWPDIAIMIQAGTFEFKNGMTEIHRDADGKIREINTKIKRFRS